MAPIIAESGMALADVPNKRKRHLEKTCEEGFDPPEDEFGEEYDVVLEPETRIRKPARKQGRRVSGVYREIITLAKVGQDAKAIECVLSRFPADLLQKVACISSIWCTVVYRVLRRQLGGCSPFTRVWSHEQGAYMNFSGELHYHSELMAAGHDNHNPQVDTVITLATKVMEDIFYDDEDELKFPHTETVIYGLTEKVLANKPNYWDPYSDFEEEWAAPETKFKSMVASLFIPKSNYFDIVPFSAPTNTHDGCDNELFQRILLKNYQLEADDELPMERSVKAVLLFQFYQNHSFLQSFVDCANQQDINCVGGVFNVIGFNTNDEHCTEAVGLSFWAKTDDQSCLNICSYAVCMSTNAGAENKFEQMKEQCRGYKNAFVIMFACSSDEDNIVAKNDMRFVSEEANFEDEQDWTSRGGGQGTRSKYIREGMKLFRHYLKDIPMIGAVTENPLVMGTNVLGDTADANGPIDLGFLVVTYN